MHFFLRAIRKLGLAKIAWLAARLFLRKSLPETDAKDTVSRMNNWSEMPSGTSIGRNQTDDAPKYDLMIVVPAYNAEKYLRQCLDSVLEQKSPYRVLLRVVDDGSLDETGAILESYGTRPDFEILTQKNAGPAAARNTAIRSIPSRYVMFLDADDFLEPDSIRRLLDAAFADQADIVEGNYVRCDSHGVRYAVRDRHEDGLYPEAFGHIWGFTCIKLMKAELFRAVLFPEHFWFEDTIISMLIFPQASSARTISSDVYVYRVNESGMTSIARNNKKSLDSYWILQLLLQELVAHGIRTSQGLYEQFLHQVMITQQRLAGQPEEIRRAAFLAGCALKERYFSGYSCRPGGWLRDTETVMLRRRYSAFSLLCRLAL